MRAVRACVLLRRPSEHPDGCALPGGEAVQVPVHHGLRVFVIIGVYACKEKTVLFALKMPLR